MRSRDAAEIKAIANEITSLVDDLNATVAALQTILSPTTTASRQEDEPDDRQRRPAS